MKIDFANLTPEGREAIVECLRIAARRGRQLREARERVQQAALADSLQTSGSGETDNRLPSADQPKKAKANQPDQSDSHFDERADRPEERLRAGSRRVVSRHCGQPCAHGQSVDNKGIARSHNSMQNRI